MTDVRSQDTKSGYRLPTFMAAVWVVVFFFWFFSLDFDTGGKAKFTRWQLWNLVPELADFVDPPEPEPGVLARPESAHSGWQYLLQRLDLVAVAASILAGAWGAGHLVLRVVRPALVPRSAERTVFAFGLGLSALSLLTLAAGLAGALSRPLLGSLLAVCSPPNSSCEFLASYSPPSQGGAGGGLNSSRRLPTLKTNHLHVSRQRLKRHLSAPLTGLPWQVSPRFCWRRFSERCSPPPTST